MPEWIGYSLIYLGAVNLITFIAFGVDKWKAKHNKWRIPESYLLGMSLIGGAAGGIIAMQVFHHKTQHWYFRFGLPVMVVVHIALIFWF